jgi:hypothetical protein
MWSRGVVGGCDLLRATGCGGRAVPAPAPESPGTSVARVALRRAGDSRALRGVLRLRPRAPFEGPREEAGAGTSGRAEGAAGRATGQQPEGRPLPPPPGSARAGTLAESRIPGLVSHPSSQSDHPQEPQFFSKQVEVFSSRVQTLANHRLDANIQFQTKHRSSLNSVWGCAQAWFCTLHPQLPGLS